MKKLDGMMPPTLVLADEGKNGDFGPPPSPFIVTGALSGFTIRASAEGCAFAYANTPTGRISANAAAAGTPIPKARDDAGIRSVIRAYGTSAITPRIAVAMWARSAHAWAWTLPNATRYAAKATASAKNAAAAIDRKSTRLNSSHIPLSR